MRKYLFRGKSKQNGEWLYGSLVTGLFFRNGENGEKEPIYSILDPDLTEDYESFQDFDEYGYVVIPETVGQFVEKADSNSRDIYDGDIVEIYASRRVPYIGWRPSINDRKRHRFVGLVEWDSEQWNVDFKNEASYKNLAPKGGEVNTRIIELDYEGNDFRGWNAFPLRFVILQGARVIGNIHDNPELLRGQ